MDYDDKAFLQQSFSIFQPWHISFILAVMSVNLHNKLLFHQPPTGTVITRWLDSDSVVIVVNYRQNGDNTEIGSSVSELPAVSNVTTLSLSSHR